MQRARQGRPRLGTEAGWEARLGVEGVRDAGSPACTPGRQSGRLRGLPASTFFFFLNLFVRP